MESCEDISASSQYLSDVIKGPVRTVPHSLGVHLYFFLSNLFSYLKLDMPPDSSVQRPMQAVALTVSNANASGDAAAKKVTGKMTMQ